MYILLILSLELPCMYCNGYGYEGKSTSGMGLNPCYEVIILRTRWGTELFIKCNEIVMMFVN